MDLLTLSIFAAVAREHSVTRAAEFLGRVPSNVTTRIQQLEAELGVSLFQRQKKRMELTAEGEIYLDYAGRILSLAEEAQQVIDPTSRRGVLRVGTMEATAATRLPKPLAAFNARWPEVMLEVSTGPSRSLVDALLARRIDCALIAFPPGDFGLVPNGVDLLPLFREQLVLVLPPGHPVVHLSLEIRPRSLAAFASGCTYRMLALYWLSAGDLKPLPVRVHEVGSYHAMLACTAAGSSFCVLPRGVLELMPDADRFTVKSLLTADTHLASRPGFATPAFEGFREMLLAASDVEVTCDAT